MNEPLIINSEMYRCMYVTTAHNSQEVISASKEPMEAYNEAKAKGCNDPVLIYVPDEDDCIYNEAHKCLLSMSLFKSEE